MASSRPRRAAAPDTAFLRDEWRMNNFLDQDDANVLDEASDSEESQMEEEDQSGSNDESEEDQDTTSSEEDNHEVAQEVEEDAFYGRNGFQWNKDPPFQLGRRPRHDIIRQQPGPTRNTRTDNILESFLLFCSNEILQNIINCTNRYAEQFIAGHDGEWYEERWFPVDMDEMKAFIACLLFAGVMKSRNESYDQLWAEDVGRPFLRASMSLSRFKVIMKFLRFDNPQDRAQRRHRDRLAAFRDVWEMFIQKCRTCYNPSTECTVDEQLVGFRGRCIFRVYMPKKPDRYGLKIWWLADAETGYAYNAQIYLGRQGNLPEVGLAERVVCELSRPLYNSGRNLTVDNFFTSVPLAQTLLRNGLTLVGTMKKNKGEIPEEFKNSNRREVYSSEFGFHDQLSLCSYVPKKGRAVVLLSTLHHRAEISEGRKRKPQIISDYNISKGGVDTLDQCVHAYSCSRKSNRWPTKLAFNMLDVMAYNGYVIFISHNPDWNRNKLYKRRLYLLELTKQLAATHMRRRAQNQRLRVSTKQALQLCGIEMPVQVQPPAPLQADRGRCTKCQRRNQVKSKCIRCRDFTCVNHSRRGTVCNDCFDQ